MTAAVVVTRAFFFWLLKKTHVRGLARWTEGGRDMKPASRPTHSTMDLLDRSIAAMLGTSENEPPEAGRELLLQ